MTYLSGDIVLSHDQHRLFDSVNTLTVVAASLLKAMQSTAGEDIIFRPSDNMSAGCLQFPIDVLLPVHLALETALQNLRPRSITLTLTPKIDFVPTSQYTPRTADIVQAVIAALFTAYFENYRHWLSENFSTDPHRWPDVWNFARQVRNAFVHGGRVNIDNVKTPPVSWYGLTYGPAENRRKIIGVDLAVGDLLILLLEMDDQLDRLGCALGPSQ